MKIDVRQREGVTILDVKGKITIGTGDGARRAPPPRRGPGGARPASYNHGVRPPLDSSGVGELVSSYTTATHRGAKLKLVNLAPKVQDVLTVTQLITVFDVYDTEDEAIRSF